jgi:hypothetical protein
LECCSVPVVIAVAGAAAPECTAAYPIAARVVVNDCVGFAAVVVSVFPNAFTVVAFVAAVTVEHVHHFPVAIQPCNVTVCAPVGIAAESASTYSHTDPASDVSAALVTNRNGKLPYNTPVTGADVPVTPIATTTPFGVPDGVCVNVRSPVVVSTLLTPVVPFVVGNRVSASWATATLSPPQR